MRQELLITDGYLMKEPKKASKLKSSYYRTFVSIDFHLKVLRFKSGDSTFFDSKFFEFKSDKDMSFTEVLDVCLLDLDVFK